MNNFTIRRANIADIPAINGLLGQVLLVHHIGRPDIFKEKGQKYTEEELSKILLDDDNPVFVYEDETGSVLGHCFCQTVHREESSNSFKYSTIYIDDLCVDENARGKKVGTKLYEYVKAYAKDNGYYNVTLHAWECNPNAVAFYKSLGLQIQQYTMEEIIK